MYKQPQKDFKLFYLIIVFIFSFIFLMPFVNAEVDTLLPEDKNIEVIDYGTDYESNYDETSDAQEEKSFKKKIKYRNKNLELRDKVFNNNNKEITMKDLFTRVSFIVLFLLIFLFVTKIFLSRYKFERPGNFLDNIAHKLQNTFSPTSGIKLKQTLILTPGQNLYVVEVDYRKLLLGGTHQGGVQFLADITNSSKSNFLDFKKIEEYQVKASPVQTLKPVESPFVMINQNQQTETNIENFNQQKLSEGKELSQGVAQIKQPLKRRSSFRQTLLSK